MGKFSLLCAITSPVTDLENSRWSSGRLQLEWLEDTSKKGVRKPVGEGDALACEL